MAVDPICKMNVSENALLKAEYNSKWYFFCGPNCEKTFKANPSKFVR
jgi:YHS domain-containing protein